MHELVYRGVFVVAIIYWTAILVLFLWLSRRLAALKAKVMDLERAVLEAKDKDRDED
ncbi:MAG: hypothetical protein OCU20_01640 [Methanophagales archaeon]|nr:hypothetical protein [Methanophagales archaeon]